jgi:hypothetical protein
MKRFAAPLLVLLSALSCAGVAAGVWPGRWLRTSDENRDGRPDVWRHYNTRGDLVEVDVDSNFDGRPDIEEYYDRGVLIRRESDRNFNGQADLVEEFDARTHHATRSIIDVDDDGLADLLVLFSDGRPVSYQRARPERREAALREAVRRAGGAALAPLADPFDLDAAVSDCLTDQRGESCAAIANTGAMPIAPAHVIASSDSSALRTASGFEPDVAIPLFRPSRAPPRS